MSFTGFNFIQFDYRCYYFDQLLYIYENICFKCFTSFLSYTLLVRRRCFDAYLVVLTSQIFKKGIPCK